MIAFLLAFACSGEPRPSALPTTDPSTVAEPPPLLAPAPPAPLHLGEAGPVVIRLRDRLGDAALVLPDSSLGPSDVTNGRFVLGGGW
ncbi:MAG: hypothetical protein VX000_05495, partial [Myxococcota bacterium]|nr:hypothetical protein [Myxococcota bacterium]